jgi:hypothetical protein
MCVYRTYVRKDLWRPIFFFVNRERKISLHLTDNFDGLWCVFVDTDFYNTAVVSAVVDNLKIQNIQISTHVVIYCKYKIAHFAARSGLLFISRN